MAIKTIKINISSKELEERRLRCEMQRQFKKPDRVPVVPILDAWYWLSKIGKSYKEYFSSAKSMLECQLLAQKWFLENIRSDLYKIIIHPVFAYVSEAGTFGAEVEFRENDIPWVKKHPIENDDDLEKLEKIDPISSGLHGKELKFREDMLKIAGNYKIRFRDGLEIGIEDKIGINYNVFSYAEGLVGIMGVAGRTLGPMIVANDLRGSEKMYMDVIASPEFAKRLLNIVTDKIIKWIEYTKEIMGESKEGVFIGDDGAGNLSPTIYREVLLPFHKKIKEYFGGYTTFHTCGKVEHLFKIISQDLGVDDFSGVGYQNDKDIVANNFGGNTVLSGNINPNNIDLGTRESIIEECRDAIEHFASFGGYFLKGGDDPPPTAPVENINYMYEASLKYGKY
jgi:uroporphyrinogen-III decarboxylase